MDARIAAGPFIASAPLRPALAFIVKATCIAPYRNTGCKQQITKIPPFEPRAWQCHAEEAQRHAQDWDRRQRLGNTPHLVL